MKFQLEVDINSKAMHSDEDVRVAIHAVAKIIEISANNYSAESPTYTVVVPGGREIGHWKVVTEDTNHCLIMSGPEPRVQHWDCDEHPNGTITNPLTGEVIKAVVN
jgi:hypothetical protein